MEREREQGCRQTQELKTGLGTGVEIGWEKKQERGREWRPVDERGTETETVAEMEVRAVAEMGTGTRIRTGTRTRTELWRAEERRRSASDLTRAGDAMWETGETRVERGKNVNKKGLVQYLSTQVI